jgi:pimeloyl-ACP methyl ester carboxylesterase
MATPRPRRRSRLGARLAIGLLGAVSLCAGLAGAWFTYTDIARTRREIMSPQALAHGRGRWVRAADADIYLQEWGDPKQPTLLLTHGTGAWSGTWFALPDALAAAGWHVVAIDLPPFGLSLTAEGTRIDYSRAAQARRVLAVIDTLDAPVTLIGHSFGAGPALEAAMHAGTRLRQLVLVDPALGLGADGSPPQCTADDGTSPWLRARGVRTALVAASATWPGFTGTMLKQFVHRKEVVTDTLVQPYQVPFTRQGFSASLGDWAIAFAQTSCEGLDSLEPQKLRAWAANGPPVALIWGEQDSITPIAQATALRSWMPSATLATLPDVGHIPHIENPGAFAEVLIRQLR